MKHYNDAQFETYDLALASALVSSGYTLASIEKKQYGNRSSFIFNRSEKLDEVLQAYWSDQLQVNPKAYFDVLKHIKTRLTRIEAINDFVMPYSSHAPGETVPDLSDTEVATFTRDALALLRS